MPLKRLVSKMFGELPPGDLATDDWSPVPAGATARPEDTIDWLLEDDGQVLPSLLDLPVTPLEPELEPQQPSYLQYFSPEELAIIDQQKNVEPEPPIREPSQPVAEPRPRRETMRWANLLRACGEYLSEAELKIIRQQLATSS